jgi:hypothetical protein
MIDDAQNVHSRLLHLCLNMQCIIFDSCVGCSHRQSFILSRLFLNLMVLLGNLSSAHMASVGFCNCTVARVRVFRSR